MLGKASCRRLVDWPPQYSIHGRSRWYRLV